MIEITDEEFAAAEERGRIEMLTKPRALSARYEPSSGRIVLELTNDSTFAFLPRRLQGLEQATDAQLAEVEVMGVGCGLGWDELDTHYTVEGLLAGRFGSRAYEERRRADPAFYALAVRVPDDQPIRKDAA